MSEFRIKVESWEADEKIITVNGKPVGGTLHKNDAETIRRWMESAITEIPRRCSCDEALKFAVATLEWVVNNPNDNHFGYIRQALAQIAALQQSRGV